MKAKHRISKVASFLLAVLMVCSAMSIGSFAAPIETDGKTSVEVDIPNGTENPDKYDCAVVTNAEELKTALAAGKSVILGGDIDLGTDGSATNYSATPFTMAANTLFEGNGYSLKNFTLSNDSYFLNFAGNAVVQNLTIGGEAEEEWIVGNTTKGMFTSPSGATVTYNNVDVYVDFTRNVSCAGWTGDGISGNSYLNNCSVNGRIQTNETAAQTGNKGKAIGGFFGWAGSAVTISMVNCVNNAAIDGGHESAGFVAHVEKTTVSLTGCVNNGTVSGRTAVNGKGMGGFIGLLSNFTQSGQRITLESCTNNGAVSGTTEIGGFIGGMQERKTWDSNTILINNCKNYGDISGNGKVGGFWGKFYGAYSTGTHTISNCQNYGAIMSQNGEAAGIIAYAGQYMKTPLTVTKCVNYGPVESFKGGGVGGLVGDVSLLQGGPVIISDCANLGAVAAKRGGQAAGIICGTSFNSNAAGYTPDLQIINTINRGSVEATSNAAGIITSAIDVKIDGCVNIGTINAGTRVGNISAYGSPAYVKNSYGFGKLTGGESSQKAYLCAYGASSYENNKYLPLEGFTPNQVVDAENGIVDEATLDAAVKDITEAVTLLNEKYGDLDFAAGTDGAIYVTTPVIRGTQNTVPDDKGLQKVRFIATLNADAAALKSIGFTVTYTYNDGNADVVKGMVDGAPTAVTCNWIYKSIKATENGKTYTYHSADLGGDYIYALSIAGVPTNVGDVTFSVTPFTVDHSGKEVMGQSWTVVYSNGEFASAAKN